MTLRAMAIRSTHLTWGPSLKARQVGTSQF